MGITAFKTNYPQGFVKLRTPDDLPTQKALEAGHKEEYLCQDGGVILLRKYAGAFEVEHLSNTGKQLDIYTNTRYHAAIRKFKQKCKER